MEADTDLGAEVDLARTSPLTWKWLEVGGTEPLARMLRSKPPGNLIPNILTIPFIFSTAAVDR